MKLYAVFSRGARGNCLIRLIQYPPLIIWLSVKNTKTSRHTLILNDVETNDQQCQSSSSTSFSADTVGYSCPPEVPNIFTKYINKRETTNNTNPTPRVQQRKYLEEVLTMTVLPSNIFDFWKEKSEEFLLFSKSQTTSCAFPLRLLELSRFLALAV